MKTALVTGIHGQDGTLLTARLLRLGYRVVGVARSVHPGRNPGASVLAIDLCDRAAVTEALDVHRPDEVYHLAAAHHSSEGADRETTHAAMIDVNFRATGVIADAMLRVVPRARMLFAGSSQMHAAPERGERVIDEGTPFRPSTFYGVTKSSSALLVDHLRRAEGFRAVTAILFNHESPLRSTAFISRKITAFAARARRCVAAGRADRIGRLRVRDVTARVDWSAAEDVVGGMHLALQGDTWQDYVLASGRTHTVQDWLDTAFGHVGLAWRDHVDAGSAGREGWLVGNPTRARTALGWEPEVDFQAMVARMVDAEPDEEAGG